MNRIKGKSPPCFRTTLRLSHESTLRVNRCLKRQCSVRSHQFSDHGGPQRGEMLRWHAQQQHSEEQEHLSVEDGHLRQTQTLHQTLWAQRQIVKLNDELVLLRETSSCSTVCHNRTEVHGWQRRVIFTLDVWQVFLVLVHFAAVNGKCQAFEQHGSLLKLSISVGEQTQRAALRYSHSGWGETHTTLISINIKTSPESKNRELRQYFFHWNTGYTFL